MQRAPQDAMDVDRTKPLQPKDLAIPRRRLIAGLGRAWVWSAAILILICTAMAISGGWQRHLHNVYRAKLREIRDRGEPISPADLAARFPRVPADKEMDALLRNLFPGLDLEAGQSPFQESQLVQRLRSSGESLAPMTAQELATLDAEVHTNAPAIDALLEVDLSGVSWRRNCDEGINVLQWMRANRIMIRRGLCEALAIRAIWEAEQGRPDRAAIALDRGFQVARIHDPVGAVSVGFQFGCEGELLRAVERCLNRCRWDEPSLRRLAACLPRHPSKMIEEYTLANRATTIALVALDPPTLLTAVGGIPRLATRWCSILSHHRGYGVRLRQLRDLTTMVEASRLPLREGLAEARKLEARLRSQRNGSLRQFMSLLDADLMVDSMLWGKVDAVFISNLKSWSGLEIARAAVAIERWRLEHGGQLPNSWSDLVPAYLPEVPLDPADDQPLRYLKSPGAGYRVYSCGADLADDGGALVTQEWWHSSGYDVVLRMEH